MPASVRDTDPSLIVTTDKMVHAQLLGLSTKKSSELAPLIADPHRCTNPSVAILRGRPNARMSVSGQKRKSARLSGMSGLPLKAGIRPSGWDVG